MKREDFCFWKNSSSFIKHRKQNKADKIIKQQPKFNQLLLILIKLDFPPLRNNSIVVNNQIFLWIL